MYTINISKATGRNWNDTDYSYAFYFRINTDMITAKGSTLHGSTLTDLLTEMRMVYPSPQYKVDVYKTVTHQESVEL